MDLLKVPIIQHFLSKPLMIAIIGSFWSKLCWCKQLDVRHKKKTNPSNKTTSLDA